MKLNRRLIFGLVIVVVLLLLPFVWRAMFVHEIVWESPADCRGISMYNEGLGVARVEAISPEAHLTLRFFMPTGTIITRDVVDQRGNPNWEQSTGGGNMRLPYRYKPEKVEGEFVLRREDNNSVVILGTCNLPD
jgi:hypothetical protein